MWGAGGAQRTRGWRSEDVLLLLTFLLKLLSARKQSNIVLKGDLQVTGSSLQPQHTAGDPDKKKKKGGGTICDYIHQLFLAEE